ncbi:c-type cytochrome [Thiovibrio frasassiensis]|uniref:Cytochrome c domain-containing protein n=1 Tax=Thiovibrio frasassiensis TaxID=2984131 RepID=A0A9X4MEU9_9BACT|nr:c-type cytochrome [Thiovibrio frasassiensis]MDG4476249.1 hypothetical protein [Thiovibrio frasassiensis]
MNRFALSLAALLLVPAFVNQAHGAPKTRYDATTKTCRVLSDGPLEWESRPWGEGGKLFANNCKSCHTRNNDKGAPFLWAESKSSAGWNRVFETRSAKCAKQGAWDSITLEQQLKLNDYLYRWASNSLDTTDSC